MIELPFDQKMANHRKSQREKLLKSYSNAEDSIEKSQAISLEDFNATFTEDKFEFYSEKLVKDFQSEVNKSEDFDAEFLKSEIDSLMKIIVKSEDDTYVNFYVKAKEVASEEE